MVRGFLEDIWGISEHALVCAGRTSIFQFLIEKTKAIQFLFGLSLFNPVYIQAASLCLQKKEQMW